MRFQKKAIFFAAPGDMSGARDYVIAAVDRRIQELSKDGEFQTYSYKDEEYPNAANTWQAEIASPLDPNCVLTVVLWGERIGKPIAALHDLDEDRLKLLSERIDERSPSIADDWLVDIKSEDATKIPLTGTVLEFLEGMMAARRNNSGFAVYVKGEERHLRNRDTLDRPFGRREHYGTLQDASGFLPSLKRESYDKQLQNFARLYDRAGELSKPWVHFTTKEELAELVCARISSLLTGTGPSSSAISFPGLAAIKADPRSLFLGRATEVEDAILALEAASSGRGKARPLAVLHGPTGAGKSSFARRGIGGELLRQGARVAVCEYVVSSYFEGAEMVPHHEVGHEHEVSTETKSPLADLLIHLAQSIGDEDLLRSLRALGPRPTVDQAIDFFREALRQAHPGWDRVVLVLDQAEMMLKRFSERAASGQVVQSTALVDGWHEVVSFADRLSRTQGKAALARQREGVHPVWVLMTAPNDATTVNRARGAPDVEEAQKPSHERGQRLIQTAEPGRVPQSKAEMLVWSVPMQEAVRVGGELVDVHLSPLSREQVDKLLRRGFPAVRLPAIDGPLIKQIADEYEWLCASRMNRDSPMPLLGLYLSKLAQIGERLTTKTRDDGATRSLDSDEDDDDDVVAEFSSRSERASESPNRQLIITKEIAVAHGASGLADTVRKLADEAIRHFIVFKFGTLENYETRAARDWNGQYPASGVSGLPPDDVRVPLARILRKSIRLTPEDDADAGTRRFVKTLATARVGGDELPLMQALVEHRLAYQTQLFQYRLMHQGLIEWWEPARFWFDREQDNLETASEFRAHCVNADRLGAALPRRLAVRVSRLFVTQSEDVEFLSVSDRRKFLLQLSQIVPSLSPMERSQILREAVTAKDDELAAEVIAQLADHDLVSWLHMGEDGNSPPLLLHALRCGHMSVYHTLRTAGAATRVRDRQDTTLVHELAWRCDARELENVLHEHPIDAREQMVNEPRSSARAPLFVAVSRAAQYADAAQADAAIFPTIKVLYDAKANLRTKNDFDRTILHQAARYGLKSVVKLLLRDAGLRDLLVARTSDGQTPLHLAAFYGHEGCVEELLRRMPVGDVDSPETDRYGTPIGRTPLWSAAQAGHSPIVLRLLLAGANPNARFNGRPTLHTAIQNGDVRTVRLLLDWNADLTSRDEQDGELNLPIHIAASEGHDAIVQMLKDRMIGAGIDPWQGNANGKTPLHVAAEGGRLAVAQKIFPRDPKVLDLVDNEGRTAFASAVRKAAKDRDPIGGAAKLAERLLARGAAVDSQDIRGRTPLHYAAGAEGMAPMLDMLLSRPSAAAQVRKINVFGETALHEAAGYGDISNVEALVRAGASTLALSYPSSRLPLHVAALRGRTDILDWLLKHDAARQRNQHLLHRDKSGKTALHHAVKGGSPSAVNALLAAGANVLTRDKNDNYASDFGTFHGDKIVIQTLLSKVKSTGARQLVVNSGLRFAAQYARADMVGWFLSLGGQPNAVDAWGLNPLHLALRRAPDSAEYLESVRLLVAAGSDPQARDGSGATAQATARRWNDPALFAVLGMMTEAANFVADESRSGAASFADGKAKKGMSCWEAAGSGSAVDLSGLLRAGVHPDVPDMLFDRPLHHACRSGQIDSVRLLVANGADVCARNWRGETPFHVAAQAGWVEGLRVLMASSTRPFFPPADRTALEWTPLHVACCEPKVSDGACRAMFELFAGARWTTEPRDKVGRTPRDYAALRNRQLDSPRKKRSLWQVSFGSRSDKKRS